MCSAQNCFGQLRRPHGKILMLFRSTSRAFNCNDAAYPSIGQFEEASALCKFRMKRFRLRCWKRADFKLTDMSLTVLPEAVDHVVFKSEKLIGISGTPAGMPRRNCIEIAFHGVDPPRQPASTQSGQWRRDLCARWRVEGDHYDANTANYYRGGLRCGVEILPVHQ